MHVFLFHVIEKGIIESFDRDRIEWRRYGHIVGGNEDVRITNNQQRSCGWTIGKLYLRLQNDGTCAFRADQRAGNVKIIFRQERRQVVTGDASTNRRKVFPDRIGISLGGSL